MSGMNLEERSTRRIEMEWQKNCLKELRDWMAGIAVETRISTQMWPIS